MGTSFSVATNAFYLLPAIIALALEAYDIGTLFFGVGLVSAAYHACIPLSTCLFSWTLSEWQINDHILAWLGITMTLIYVFNTDVYYREEFSGGKVRKYALKIGIVFVVMLVVLLSVGKGNTVPLLTPALIFTATIFVIAVSLILGNCKTSFGTKNIGIKKNGGTRISIPFIVLAIVFAMAASSVFFIEHSSIAHGIWHTFGSLCGAMLLLSVRETR